jgi:hypothetical protein
MRLEAGEVPLRSGHALDPVQAPQPRPVLERTELVVLLGEDIDVDPVPESLRAAVAGAGRVGFQKSAEACDLR